MAPFSIDAAAHHRSRALRRNQRYAGHDFGFSDVDFVAC